ncbi:serine/arginine repetitive matrix protein 4 isoform X2 [Dromaius novaehollandiae]|uniref:serine/arginine repetitive matrix protein 4 isoform X2 n=1 Tax=Dromaius novaehollandiae TaxID=8790 RepID=UPI00311EF2F8
MASVQQGEKQLFEKFWRGTFKAVATPRPESIIVASITARKPLPSSGTLSCLSCPAEDRRPEKPSGNASKEASTANGCVKGKERRDHARHRSRSRSCEGQRTPPPPPARGKKKKKKSGRKKRRRSPSYSPSPVKKKKKKSAKKRKRNRLSSKKRRHSSSSPKSKRKEERKHKKHSHGRPRKSHRHRHRHSRSESSDSHSPNCRSRARSREEGRKTRRRRSRHRSKSTAKRSSSAEVQASQKASQTLPLYSFLSPKEVISQSGSSADLFTKTDSPLGNLASQNGEYHEYDSGNDTSSPPSTQTSSSRSKDSQEKRSLVHDGFGHAFSSGKPKLANSDNSSDSGNSFTSCFSQSKGTALENLSPDAQGQDRRAAHRWANPSSEPGHVSWSRRNSCSLVQRRWDAHTRFPPVQLHGQAGITCLCPATLHLFPAPGFLPALLPAQGPVQLTGLAHALPTRHICCVGRGAEDLPSSRTTGEGTNATLHLSHSLSLAPAWRVALVPRPMQCVSCSRNLGSWEVFYPQVGNGRTGVLLAEAWCSPRPGTGPSSTTASVAVQTYVCRGCLSLYLGCSEKKRSFLTSPAHSSPLRPSSRSESSGSTGRSSPGSSRSSRCRSLHRKASPRYSRSRSCSSGKRSYSRSPSYSSKSCRKSPGSRSSRPRRSPSYSRYSPGRDREREHKYGSSEKESHRERDRRRRQRSYSPLRKRRRDSPSHLEARRITSARKRPIPYYRPSPSSSSSASSYSSWYSSFSRSPSRSRSRSYSSYRTSRSRSWSSSSDNGRSRSRSSGPRSSRSRSKSSDSGGSSDSLRR